MISNVAVVDYILSLKNPPIDSRKLVEYLGNWYPEIFLKLHGLESTEPEIISATAGECSDNPSKTDIVYITKHDANQILLYMYSGDKISAIKHLRNTKLGYSLNFGLKESKDIVDRLHNYLYSIGKFEYDYPTANLSLSLAQRMVLDDIKRSI